MQVKPGLAPPDLLHRTAPPVEELERAGLGVVDGLAIDVHPLTDFLKTFDGLVGERAVSLGSDIEQEVAALGGDIRQLLDQVLTRLPMGIGLVPPPLAVHRHARFPVNARQSRRGNLLLRRAKVSPVCTLFRQAVHALAPLVDTVVDDDVVIEPAHVFVQVFAHLVRPGAFPLTVKPHHPGVVVLDQLLELPLHVGYIFAVVGLTLFRHCTGVPTVLGRVVRMVPIHDGVVETHPDVVLLARFGQRTQQILLVGRRLNVVLGDLAGPEAEAVMMLRGDHDVLHAGTFCHLHPGIGIELHRVELIDELVIGLNRDLCGPLDPFGVVRVALPLTGRNCIQPPVDEHAEARLAPPSHARITLLSCFGNPNAALVRSASLGRLALRSHHSHDQYCERCTPH